MTAPSAWIPVTERLPEGCEDVIVTSVLGVIQSTYVRTAFYKDGAWWRGGSALGGTVLAWQPLPAPYVSPEKKEDRS